MLADELKTLDKYLDKLLKKGWIRKSKSSIGALIIFVPKPNGDKRGV